MKQLSCVGRSIFSRGSRLRLSVLALALVCLTAYSLTRTWWPTQGVRAQGGNTPTFTSFDASGAGSMMLQGTVGTSINASGVIAGIYLTMPNVAHGFVRAADGTITEFDAPDAGTGLNEGTFPASINANSDITGFFSDANVSYRGFVRSGATGTITEFDFPGAPTTTKHRGTSPTAINANGDITGFYRGLDDVIHGFLRTSNGTFTSLDVPAAGTAATQGTLPFSINAAGMITGEYTDSNHVNHGFIGPAAGPFTTFDAPNAAPSSSGITKKILCCGGTFALNIDAAGDVAGLYTDVNAVGHGFLRAANGTFTAPIDAPAATTTGSFPGTLVDATNDSGVILGLYSDSNGALHGFVRAADGTFTSPLSAPLAGSAGAGKLPGGTAVVSISDSGAVTGGYFDSTFVLHGFLLTPEQAATPTFNPPAGTYASTQSVTISDTTPNASFFYTTDGSTPTSPPTGTTVAYSGPINVAATETINAIAVNPAGWLSTSQVGAAAYTISNQGPPPSFSVSVNPTSLTITAGKTGMAMFTVTPQNGFNSQVSLACKNLPSEANCNFNPPNLTPNGAPVSSTLMLSTMAPSALLRPPAPISARPGYALVLCGAAMMLCLAARRRRPRRALQFLGAVILLAAASGISSCGGGNHVTNPGTLPGTTMVSVTASAGANGGSQTATLTITIIN